MFIVFDGIDGCGKTRQADLFQLYCEQTGLTSSIHRDPGGSPAGSKIRSILLDKTVPLDPVSQLLLFSASRNELYKIIKEQLSQVDVVISDRWLFSTLAYQCHALGVDRDLAIDLYKRTIGLFPSVYVVIDVDAETALARKEHRAPPLGGCSSPKCQNHRSEAPGRRATDEVDFAKNDDRFESMGVSVQEKMRHGYLKEVELHTGIARSSTLETTHFIVMDGNYSPEVLAAMIREEIGKLHPKWQRMFVPAAVA